MPKIDLSAVPRRTTCAYPAPLDEICAGRVKQALGAAGGLTQFGVNLTQLAPGAATGQRHWHESEDEFVFIIAGAPTLIDEQGETPLAPGDALAYPKGEANAHHIVNKSDALALLLEVGTRGGADDITYPDVDLHAEKSDGGWWVFTRKDGTPLRE